jgi:hypothetical protein
LGLFGALLVVFALMAGGLYFFVLKGNSYPGSITFNPSTVNCTNPVAQTITIKLPASVKATDPLTEKFDGATVGNTLTLADSGDITKQADGSWSGTSTSTAAQMQTDCATGQNDAGQAVLTSGTHTMQILDASGQVLAQGSYTVSGGTATSDHPATKAPSIPPSANIGKITFNPPSLSCNQPVHWLITAYLPSSLQVDDSIDEILDGYDFSSLNVEPDTMVKQADGSWLYTDNFTIADIEQVCSQTGVYYGANLLVPGAHTFQFVNAATEVLAQGTYRVTGTLPKPTAVPTPTPAPTTVADQGGQVLFSLTEPDSTIATTCQVLNPISQIDNMTSIYAIYIFTATQGSTPVYIAVTKDGKTYVAATALPTADTKGYQCLGDTTDYSQLPNWGPGLYHITLTSGGKVISQGDLKVILPGV